MKPIFLQLSKKEFKSILLSHGWYDLPPFRATLDPPSLSYSFSLPSGKGEFSVFSVSKGCNLDVKFGSLKLCEAVLGNCLSLEADLTELYDASSSRPCWSWIKGKRLGRFLRSASLFEDCCNVIFTTNINWSGTERMVASAVSCFGEQIYEGKAFPVPQRLIEAGEVTLRKTLKCGFRARYVLELCQVALKYPTIFLGQEWQQLGSNEFREKICSILGIGPVSAAYLGRMYHRPDGFAVDSYVMRRCSDLWGVPPGEIEKFVGERYAHFANSAPLAFWLEITKHWHKKSPTDSGGEW